jgi:hypothetical protein
MKKILNGLAAHRLPSRRHRGSGGRCRGSEPRLPSRRTSRSTSRRKWTGPSPARSAPMTRPAAARPEDLQGSLFGLPFDEPRGLPHAGRPRLLRSAGEGFRRRSMKCRTARTATARCSPARRARPTTSRRPSRTTSRRCRRQRRRCSARLLADRQGARRRRAASRTFVFDIFTHVSRKAARTTSTRC